MGKLILEIQMSIDGFIAAADGDTNWMLWNWGPEWSWDKELQQHHTDLNLSASRILISRQMAEEGFIAHWRSAAESQDDARYQFAKHITDTPKTVFSKSLEFSVPIPGGWDNADISKEELVHAVNELKEKHDRMIVYGGASFVASLIRAGLIDEFHLLVNPVVLGNGMSIFDSLERMQHMTLIQAKSFKSGMVLLHYQLKS